MQHAFIALYDPLQALLEAYCQGRHVSPEYFEKYVLFYIIWGGGGGGGVLEMSNHVIIQSAPVGD